MNDTTLSFETLIALARTGDRDAMQAIARAYEADLRIAVRVWLGPALRPYLDSMDLVQSVHRSLLVGLRDERFEISSQQSLIALAIVIVKRKISRSWRKNRRQIRELAGSTESVPELLASLSGRAKSPQMVIDVSDEMQHLWQQLDTIDQEFLSLRLQGHSIIEVAERMQKSPEALRIRLHRLRKRLEAAQVVVD